MPPKFHVPVVKIISPFIAGIITLFAQSPAAASPLTTITDICRKDSWPQLSFLQELCQTAETPAPKTNESNQDPENTPDRSTEEAAPAASTSKSGDFILFKFDVNIGLGGGGDQLGFGNSFAPSEPIPPAPTPVQPSPKATKAPKKTKAAKPQKSVPSAPNRGSLPPKQIKPLSPKKHQLAPNVIKSPGKQPATRVKILPSRPLRLQPKAIKNSGKQPTIRVRIPLSRSLQLQPKAHPQIRSIVVPKTMQLQHTIQFNQPLKRPMVQPSVQQPLRINRSISKPLPRRGK